MTTHIEASSVRLVNDSDPSETLVLIRREGTRVSFVHTVEGQNHRADLAERVSLELVVEEALKKGWRRA